LSQWCRILFSSGLMSSKLIPPGLHPLQRTIVACSSRFRVVVCGRRWGKTRAGAYLALREVVRGRRVWWVAPVYSQAMLAWRLLRPLFAQLPNVLIAESTRCIRLGRGELWIKSADNPDTLRGEGLDGVVIDEADYTSEVTWTQSLRPALADRKGWALFISTPHEIGGWFQKLYERGQSREDAQWASWQYPSWTNPFLDPAEIDQARADMSELEFRQEFGAEFVGRPDAVYHNWEPRAHVAPCSYTAGLPLYVGLDFNNSPRVAVFLQKQGEMFCAIGEVYHPYQATTDEHAAMVVAWLSSRGINHQKGGPVVCIADASGAAKQHTGKSDHQAFKDAGFALDVPPSNPPIRDRDNAVLSYLRNAKGEVRIKVDPSCRHLIEAFGKFKHGDRSRSPWGHILDAFGYVIHRKTAKSGGGIGGYS